MVDADDRLFHAAWKGDPLAVERMIREGASPLAERDGLTPLHLASAAGSMGAANVLIQAGARVDAEAWPDRAHFECLAAALSKWKDNPRLLQEKVTRECPPASARDPWWRTISARSRRGFIGDGERGALGCTPLHLASDGGHADLVSLLLAHGADPYMEVYLDGGVEGFWEWTPTGLARGQPAEKPHSAVLGVLERHMRDHPQSEESRSAQPRRRKLAPF